MKKVKISIIIIIILSLTLNRTYAIYHYSFLLNAFELGRDDSPITYSIVRNNEQGYTNQDVDVLLTFNKEVDSIDGYTKLQDGNSYQKTFSDNENVNMEVTDVSGNKCNVSYSIDNIDKIPPTINNIENGVTYSGPIVPVYDDNVGIASIDVKKYRDLELSLFPDYVDSSDYKGLDLLDKSLSVRILRKT